MDANDKRAAVTAIFEGIMAAHNTVAHEGNSTFEDFHVYAQAALASLESAGFKIERAS